jgi:predicted N-acyltransferase
MKIHIVDSVRAAGEREWQEIVGPTHLDQSYGWFRTVEDSGMQKTNYVLVKDGSRLRAAACATLIRLRGYGTVIPCLTVASPLTVTPAFFSRTREETGWLLKGLRRLQRRENARGFFILVREPRSKDAPRIRGSVTVPLEPVVRLDLGFSSFDEYLSSLPRNPKKSIKATLSKARRYGLRIVVTNEFSRWKETARRLQGFVCEQHQDWTWHLTGAFYEALETHLRDKVDLILVLKDDTPLAVFVLTRSPEAYQLRFAGIDPRYHEHHAYFFGCYETIRMTIERGARELSLGLTTYEYKEKIGGVRVPQFALGKMNSPMLDALLRIHASREKMRLGTSR